MINLSDKIKEKLSEDRYKHTINVLETATKLGKAYDIPNEKIFIASLLHDYAKELTSDEVKSLILEHEISTENNDIINIDLIHGELGSLLAKANFGIEDIDILNAIRYHTTGREDMSVLEKIIYLADVIEPSRDFEGLDPIRNMANSDLDKAVLMAMDKTIEYLIRRGSTIHIDTIKARNYIIKEISKRVNRWVKKRIIVF